LPRNETDKIQKYCSFDGDADRIVYYYLEGNGQVFHLLDGDKISTLVATYLKELVKNSSIEDQIKLCIVQTAYANGNSTNYIQDIMVNIMSFKIIQLVFFFVMNKKILNTFNVLIFSKL